MSVVALSIWSKFVPVRVIVLASLLSYATAVIVEAGLEASMSIACQPAILSVPVGTVVEVITLP